MKTYRLTAFNLKEYDFLEDTVFTNKKVAEQSKQNLIDYIIDNYRLNPMNEIIKPYHKGVTTNILDGLFNVTLKEQTPSKKVLKYN